MRVRLFDCSHEVFRHIHHVHQLGSNDWWMNRYVDRHWIDWADTHTSNDKAKTIQMCKFEYLCALWASSRSRSICKAIKSVLMLNRTNFLRERKKQRQIVSGKISSRPFIHVSFSQQLIECSLLWYDLYSTLEWQHLHRRARPHRRRFYARSIDSTFE